jgi:sugar lactone lactonase YvrE
MKTVACACLVAAGLLLGGRPIAADQAARFRQAVSIYADDKGAGFNLPEAVACGAGGRIVVGDTGNDRLVRFTYLDKVTTEVRVMALPELSAPSRVQLNSKGEIYALDAKQRRIVHLGPAGEFKAVLAFDGAPPPATIVPKSFAIDQADSLYVLDVFSARVLVLDAEGKFQRALALPDDVGFGSELTVEASGAIFVLDSIKRRLLSAEKGATAFVPLGGDLTGALATVPTHLTVSKGTTFILEGSGSTLVSLRRDGSFVSRQLKQGWDEGTLNHPSQMCINDKDEAFIADRDNSRIQVFQLIR